MYFSGEIHAFENHDKNTLFTYLVEFIVFILNFSYVILTGTLFASIHSETITIREGANHEH